MESVSGTGVTGQSSRGVIEMDVSFSWQARTLPATRLAAPATALSRRGGQKTESHADTAMVSRDQSHAFKGASVIQRGN
ncbi:unnamed protein product [Lampetra fluviatilis]